MVLQKFFRLTVSNYVKTFDCVNYNKLWKILKEMGLTGHLTCLLQNLYASEEPDMEQWTGLKLGN